MTWEVEYCDEFEAWWLGLNADEQESVAADRLYDEHLETLRTEGLTGD